MFEREQQYNVLNEIVTLIFNILDYLRELAFFDYVLCSTEQPVHIGLSRQIVFAKLSCIKEGWLVNVSALRHRQVTTAT